MYGEKGECFLETDRKVSSYRLYLVNAKTMKHALVQCVTVRQTLSPSDQAPISRKSRKFSGTFGVTILFASSKRRRLEARNFAVIFVYTPLKTHEKTSFTE